MMLAPVAEGSLRLEKVSRRFGGRSVVDVLSFEAGPGDVVGLVGPNGSGKTTALRLIAGTMAPSEGTVSVGNVEGKRGSSGFVPAGDRGLYWRITVRQNLRFFARLGEAANDWREAVAAASEALDLAALLESRVEACSTGQRRRVMIARAAVSMAPVFLIDEPFEGLDDEGIRRVTALVTDWARAGGVVVWAAPADSHGPPATTLIRMEST